MLIDDSAALAFILSELTQADFLRLRFDVVTAHSCEPFQADCTHARLICTYRGSGTQYIPAACETKRGHIDTVPTGSPIIMCGNFGDAFPQADPLYRASPFEGTKETRLVLVIDSIMDPESQTSPHFATIH